MKKHSILFVFGLILFAIIFLYPVGYIFSKIVQHNYQEKILDHNRHLLFCETLSPEMSISEVFDILNGTGNLIKREKSVTFKHTGYSILFTDEREQDLYGGWIEINFVDGKYNGAYILGFEYIKEICNFGLISE